MTEKKRVFVYGPGHDGSNELAEALKLSKELDVDIIHTLNRSLIANHILSKRDLSLEHIRASEKILRKDIPDGKKLFFITLLSDPFYRHIRKTFSFLRKDIPSQIIAHEL